MWCWVDVSAVCVLHAVYRDLDEHVVYGKPRLEYETSAAVRGPGANVGYEALDYSAMTDKSSSPYYSEATQSGDAQSVTYAEVRSRLLSTGASRAAPPDVAGGSTV
jgi:hypothetical protein